MPVLRIRYTGIAQAIEHVALVLRRTREGASGP